MRELPKNIVCILNPARRRSQAATKALVQQCDALGLPAPRVVETSREHPGDLQAQNALAWGADLVIAAGGDGTVRNVGKELSGTGVPLGIIPIGTANIFHLNAIGKRGPLDQAARTALLGADISVDMGKVELTFADSEQAFSEQFLVVVGVGRDALTLKGVSESWKRRVGPLAYFLAGARQVLGSSLPMTVSVDGRELRDTSAWSILIGNCGVVPGGITVLPQSDLSDGHLDYLHVAPKHLGSWLPIGIAGLTGHRRSPAATESAKVKHVTIKLDDPSPVQIDGDVYEGVVRVDVSVQPQVLTIRGGSPR